MYHVKLSYVGSDSLDKVNKECKKQKREYFCKSFSQKFDSAFSGVLCREKLWVYKIGLCWKKISESSSFKSTQLFKTERSSSHPAICFIRINFYNKKKYEKRSLAFFGRLFCQFTILSCQDGVPNYIIIGKTWFYAAYSRFFVSSNNLLPTTNLEGYVDVRKWAWFGLAWVAELYSLYVL